MRDGVGYDLPGRVNSQWTTKRRIARSMVEIIARVSTSRSSIFVELESVDHRDRVVVFLHEWRRSR